jgi:DNA-binding CsgD family transcriptional regulator/sugar-specific transcriptional regulator TrmB
VPADRREYEDGLLGAIGVRSPIAEQAWRTLMRHPESGREELARLAGVTSEQIGDAIDALLEAQVVRASSAPSGVTPIDPRLAIETHIARVERQLAERSAELAELRSHIADFVDDYAEGRTHADRPPVVEVVHDLDAVRHRIYLASESVVRIQRCLIRSPSAEGLRDGLDGDLKQLSRGVEQRTIISAADLADPGVYVHIRNQHARGERVRSLGKVPTQMQIMDENLAILAVDPTNPRAGAIFVRERGILELLLYVFDHLWSEADAVFDASIDPNAPTERTARILELMSKGVKDDRIARTLGIATRTLRRDIAELRGRLGVSSRSEIITAAIRRGWL